MSGVKYLLDTNIVIGLCKHDERVKGIIANYQITSSECGYSSITKMELLGYPKITQPEFKTIQTLLTKFIYYPLTSEIEDVVIELRRKHLIKLPDAIIVATAKLHSIKFLTLDEGLRQFSS
jgi:predicted nucleic acid-binding protein